MNDYKSAGIRKKDYFIEPEVGTYAFIFTCSRNLLTLITLILILTLFPQASSGPSRACRKDSPTSL